MKKFVYYAPTEIVFGPGEESKVGELVKKHGGSRVLVIYGGQSAVKSGLIARTMEYLEEAGVKAEAAGGVVPNPLLSTCRSMIKKALEFKADFILAVGGGSVIDTAKAVAHGTASPERDVWDFWARKAPVTKSLPIGVILTISAAGSETSNSAVITNDDTEMHTKRGLNTDFNRCRFAIMDPELTMTLPKWQVGAGAADIFMHTSERYFAPILGNHLSDEIAEGLLRVVMEFGPKAVENPHDYEAMSELMWCGSVSHVGLTGLGCRGETSRDGDWSCHQLGMAISALYDSTHGATLTAVWASWARYVLDANTARFAEYARKVCGVTAEDDAAAAEEGIARTEDFFRAVGMPLTLAELFGYEPGDEEIAALAEECSYGQTRTIGSFKVLTYDDMIRIYKDARA